MKNYYFKNILMFVFTILIATSCTKQKAELDFNIEENFVLRRANADMPVWVHGNSASKTFVITMHGGPGLGYGLDLRRGTYSEPLEEKYAMVYWDQRNMGSAHGHLSDIDMSVDHIVDDIYALVQTLKKRYGTDISFFLMGHSWGGTVTTAYLIKENYQDEFKGWINISGTQSIPGEDLSTANSIMELANEFIANGENVNEWQEMLDEIATYDTSISPFNKEDGDKIFKLEKKADALIQDKINSPKYRHGILHSLFGPEATPLNVIGTTFQLVFSDFWDEYRIISLDNDLHKINIPTMLAFGKYDLVSSPLVGEEIFQGISSTFKTLHKYEYSGHEPFANEPDLFSQDMINFIELHK